MVSLFKPKAKLLFTIHNLQHQGRCSPDNLKKVGLDPVNFHPQMEDPVYPEALNLMKGAILFADAVTTVSPTYLKEILTPEGGFGLDTFLLTQKEKLHGILNGIDTEYWNPTHDPHLATCYGKDIFEAKAANKRALQERFNLSSGYLMAVVTRLVPQKDPDAIEKGVRHVIEKKGQVMVLGSSPDPEIQARFEALEKELKSTGRARFYFGFDEPLAHLVYAAADSIFVPSIFEPCGLTQLIGMRYGTVPIVRTTGGLKDTVKEKENGFTFTTSKEMAVALDRAQGLYQSDPTEWQKLALKGYQGDYSWECSARRYLTLLELCGCSFD
jgi:starch synthase